MTVRRRFLLRLLAVSVPSTLGLVLLTWLLFHQGRLVWQDGQWTFRRPPLYLQEDGHEVTGHRYLYDATLGWRNIPNWQATTFGKPLHINAQGWRDIQDYTEEKPPGTRRILVLGDSYAWGYGVADEEVFARQLALRLPSSGTAWQVLNTGVSGWGSDQQYLYLKEEGLRFQPDVVVVAFFLGNDLDNNVAATQYRLHKPVFLDTQLTLGNVPVPRPGQSVDPEVLRQLVDVDRVELTVQILTALRDACQQAGCPLVVMKFGTFLAPELPYARRLSARFQARAQAVEPPLTLLDLDEAFGQRSQTLKRLTEGVDDGHWNAHGHAQVAEILHAYLEQTGLLPRDP